MNNFLAKFREKFALAQGKVNAFMSGRYGNDQLNRTLTIVWCVLLLLSTILSVFGAELWLVLAANLLCLAAAILVFFRFLSRKIFKRSAENEKYLKLHYAVTEFFKLQSLRWKGRKTHLYKKCPHCKKVMRLPRVNGKHTVRCPMCSQTYKVTIHGGEKKK